MILKETSAVEKAERALKRAVKARDLIRGRRQILCCCGKRHPINKLMLIITYFYIEPHGCTDGDYWTEGEWQFECIADNSRNRLLFDDYSVDWKDRDRIGVAAEPTFKQIYRSLFASIVKEKKHQTQAGWNNYYVDQHRERFELPLKPKM